MRLAPRNSHASAAEDLPRDMNAQEYAQHLQQRLQQTQAEGAVLQFDFGALGPRRPPPRLSQRLNRTACADEQKAAQQEERKDDQKG